MIRIAFLGCGDIARGRHAPEAYGNSEVTIAGFYDLLPERAGALAAQYGGRVYASAEEVCGDPRVDAVVVSVINRDHGSLSILALENGKHVLCEKPMAVTMEEALAMRNAAEKARRVLMIGHNLRLEPAFQEAKALLEGGTLGRVLSFEMTIGNNGPEPRNCTPEQLDSLWFFRKDKAGMGVIGDIAIHGAETLNWLLEGTIRDATCLFGNLGKRFSDGAPIEVEDTAIYLLRTKDGALGTLNASWCYVDGWTAVTTLHCEKGCLKVYGEPGTGVSVADAEGRTILKHKALPKSQWPHGSGIMHMFVEAILKGEPPALSADAGIAALRIALGQMHQGMD